ncbi:polyketide cyclase/dehydrase/lipid transport protein [Paucimonas lemoignei]|uniref:Polyketide cyclase/dehydrase/lipid transport protein n=1 Tax=Paucimonas lemoignei TaxID=29443 RepID=A0A4R3HRK6_PAULE|nr:SRPBCC family protein [Paucimonas lemoignei]TCS35602.1 polyketide cyclase/dehydrase/lipid transport protein [Paucimonas lemoignei]
MPTYIVGLPAFRFIRLLRLACLLLLCCALPAALGSEAEPERDVTVSVHKNGDMIVVDVSFSVAATQQDAWNVLTDFDHMSEFISNLQSSKVISRSGNKLQVAQIGKAARGMFSFAFESVREVELMPHSTIRSRLLSGNMQKMDGATQLSSESSGTRVEFHGESIPSVWVPPVVGTKFIGNEVQEQFREMRAEILKRKHGDARPSNKNGPAA